jgi:hypothetical protein
MKTARKKPTAAKLRSWRVIIMRSRGELLGYVEALDRERDEAVAIKRFDLDQEQQQRLLSESGFSRRDETANAFRPPDRDAGRCRRQERTMPPTEAALHRLPQPNNGGV